MRTATAVVDRPDFSVHVVRCREHDPRWSAPELSGGYSVVLPRRGGFRRRGRDGEWFVDRTMGYLDQPDQEQCFAHPAGGDECTALGLSIRLWRELFDDRRIPVALYVDARIDLAHRLLLHPASRLDPDFAAAERLVRLVGLAAQRAAEHSRGAGHRDRRLVESAREALRADHPAAVGLVPLARLLGVSPYRLSRSFHAVVGVPLTRYRNRLRVGRALDHLEQGADRLGALAADLGFADQAHLTRTIRAELGRTPGELRRVLRRTDA